REEAEMLWQLVFRHRSGVLEGQPSASGDGNPAIVSRLEVLLQELFDLLLGVLMGPRIVLDGGALSTARGRHVHASRAVRRGEGVTCVRVEYGRYRVSSPSGRLGQLETRLGRCPVVLAADQQQQWRGSRVRHISTARGVEGNERSELGLRKALRHPPCLDDSP